MKAFRTLVKVVVAGLALLIFQAIAAAIVPVKVTMQPHTLPWVVVSNLATAAVLVLLASRSDWRGWRLGLAVSVIRVTRGVTNMMEGAIFLTNTGIDWPRIITNTVITYELAVPLWILPFAKHGGPAPESYHPVDSRPIGEKLWKFAVCDVSYPILYFVAGR